MAVKKKPAAAPAGNEASPWKLTTAPGASAFEAWQDEESEPPARCLEDTVVMLEKHGDWLPLGGADEQKPAAEGTLEAWARSPKNPVKGWYGLKKGLRGRFGVYVPPVLEALGLVELEHLPKNNRLKAKQGQLKASR